MQVDLMSEGGSLRDLLMNGVDGVGDGRGLSVSHQGVAHSPKPLVGSDSIPSASEQDQARRRCPLGTAQPLKVCSSFLDPVSEGSAPLTFQRPSLVSKCEVKFTEWPVSLCTPLQVFSQGCHAPKAMTLSEKKKKKASLHRTHPV